MTYGAECWAVRKKDENRLHVAEMRMLRCCFHFTQASLTLLLVSLSVRPFVSNIDPTYLNVVTVLSLSSPSKTRKDHVRNQIIQEDAKVCDMSTFLRQKRLNWYGQEKRRRQPLKKNDGHGRSVEEKKGAA